MLYLPNYAGALRCIGQALQNQGIEAFELKTHADEFRLHAGDPNPPYLDLIELRFSVEDIKSLDRQGQALRRRLNREIRFDGLPEIMRAVGEYVDNKRGYLRRLNNSDSSNIEPAVEVGYETRVGEIKSETLPLNFIRESAVRMYKRRTRLPNTIELATRRR